MKTTHTVQSIEVAPLPPHVKRWAIGGGLTLSVHPSGRMVYERSYREAGKLRWMCFGVHRPNTDPRYITESKARVLNEEYLEKAALGITYIQQSSNITVGEVFERYLQSIEYESTSKNYRSLLDSHFGSLKGLKWTSIDDNIVEVAISKGVKERGVSGKTAKEAFGVIKRVSKFTVPKSVDIPRKDLFPNITFHALGIKIGDTKHRVALTRPDEFKSLYAYLKDEWNKHHKMSVAALLIMAHFPKRPSEILNMKWEYIDLDAREIRFPARYEKIKDWKLDYPISTWLANFIKELKEFKLHQSYVFCLRMEKPMTSSSLRMELLRDYANKHSPHGFRSSFRTIGMELNYNVLDMELMLGHTPDDQLNGAYQRIKGNLRARMDQRRELMESWSNWLEK